MKTHLATMLSCALAGCGLEPLIDGVTSPSHQQPATVLSGSVALPEPTLTVFDAEDQEITPIRLDLTGSTYAIRLPSAVYENLRVEARRRDLTMWNLVFRTQEESVMPQVDLDVDHMAETLIVLAKLGPADLTLKKLAPEVLQGTQRSIRQQLQATGPVAQVRDMLQRIFDGAANLDSFGVPAFHVPLLDESFATEESALDDLWIRGAALDYSGDGRTDTTTRAFDDALETAAQEVEFRACIHPTLIRVVFTVDFNASAMDGNCSVVNRFKWAEDKPGKRMFFVGGIHEESPIQGPEYDALLGNAGSWTPNQIAMFDDGTHGDAIAGDNLWTISFNLPKTVRLGYKYTWGLQGQGWTGSEEWPGNQRLLEVADENDDGIVYRLDQFGDEASNKDLSNLNRKGNGKVTWDTDVNKDGVPDCRERMADSDGDCVGDTWVTPEGIGPYYVDCDSQ